MYKVKLVYIKGAEIGTRKMQSYPLGVLNLKLYAESFPDIKENVKIDIEIVDYEIQDEYFVYETIRNQYDMVLFSSFIWNISRGLDLCRKIKIVDESIVVGLGGPEVDDYDDLMNNNQYLDLIMVGEGENSFVQLLNKYFLNKTNSNSGIIYREHGAIINGGKSELITNLDSIPTFVEEDEVLSCDMLVYETSRGCPFQCKYCCWAGKKMRYYSLERVERDLKKLLLSPRGNSIFLIDSELDIDIERAKEIMRIIIKYNIHNKVIQGFLGLHKIDSSLLELCKKANFIFGIGIQSVNPEAIKNCGRTWFDVKEFERKLESIRCIYDLPKIEFQLIMGLPGDDYNSFRRNLEWCRNIGARNITANRLYILPGSYFYKYVDEFKIKYDKKPYHLVYSNYTYSYDDIMRSESLLVAFQLLNHIFYNSDILYSDNEKVNFWELVDKVENIITQRGIYSQGRQESQVVEVNYKYEEIINEALKRMNVRSKIFSNYIKMKVISQRANEVFSKNRNIDRISKNNERTILKIDEYFISPLVILRNDRLVEDEKFKYFVLLSDFDKNVLKKIKIEESQYGQYVRILKKLSEGILLESLNSMNNNEFEKKIIVQLLREGLCYVV